ncbi:MAG: hypothetical protein AB1656_18855 [Candidatus Omnitrophota bacterium]
MKKALLFRNSLSVALLSTVMFIIAYGILWGERYYGPLVLASTIVPVLFAKIGQMEIKGLLPDILFGTIDTGLLTVAALIGAAEFGVIGAIVGGVIGDAVTDGIAGFFEGSLSEWLRRRGIDESRTALGSAYGKMAGCLLGSGAVLSLAALMGVELSSMKG